MWFSARRLYSDVQMLKQARRDTADDIKEIKESLQENSRRMNQLFLVVTGAVVTAVTSHFLGVG